MQWGSIPQEFQISIPVVILLIGWVNTQHSIDIQCRSRHSGVMHEIPLENPWMSAMFQLDIYIAALPR
jgi:hypothetical protein